MKRFAAVLCSASMIVFSAGCCCGLFHHGYGWPGCGVPACPPAGCPTPGYPAGPQVLPPATSYHPAAEPVHTVYVDPQPVSGPVTVSAPVVHQTAMVPLDPLPTY